MSGIVNTRGAVSGIIGTTVGTTAAASGTTPSFGAMMSATLALSADSAAICTFDTEIFDSDGCYNNSTYQFTPTTAGKYLYGCHLQFGGLSDADTCIATFRRNGSSSLYNNSYMRTGGSTGDHITSIHVGDFNGSTDSIEIWAYSNTSNNVGGSGGVATSGSSFWGFRLA